MTQLDRDRIAVVIMLAAVTACLVTTVAMYDHDQQQATQEQADDAP
jgi:hypothetical protein